MLSTCIFKLTHRVQYSLLYSSIPSCQSCCHQVLLFCCDGTFTPDNVHVLLLFHSSHRSCTVHHLTQEIPKIPMCGVREKELIHIDALEQILSALGRPLGVHARKPQTSPTAQKWCPAVYMKYPFALSVGSRWVGLVYLLDSG